MKKLAVLFMIALALPPTWGAQSNSQNECIQRCLQAPIDPEMERQEVVNLERETARAIQTNTGTLFRRIYADDFVGTMSHGQLIDRNGLIRIVEDSSAKYDSFTATDIKVRVFRETAVATSLWTSRGVFKGHRFESQMRSVHVYLYTQNGWSVVASQTTPLPPDTDHPL